MDIAGALKQAQQHIDRLDAELLLCHLLDKPRSYLRTWPERTLDEATLAAFHALIARRSNEEPLAYLIGWREFWSLRLKVTPATLIPRPDTETLVEHALTLIPTDADWRIADLGTGSGAIALAIASERPRCHIVASDLSPEALAVARDNAQTLGIHNIEFRHASWTQAFQADERFQLIASNPPYVDADDVHLQRNGLPFEPQTALTPGADGLADLRIIIEQARRHLTAPGWLLLEHGYNQGEAVRDLLAQHGYQQIGTAKDIGDNERMSCGQYTQTC